MGNPSICLKCGKNHVKQLEELKKHERVCPNCSRIHTDTYKIMCVKCENRLKLVSRDLVDSLRDEPIKDGLSPGLQVILKPSHFEG